MAYLHCTGTGPGTGPTQREQESPPASTQEVYRPPRSEYSFCWPKGGGIPSLDRGYLHHWMEVSPYLDMGVSHLWMGGTPIQTSTGGNPSLDGGTPSWMGDPHHWMGEGYPGMGVTSHPGVPLSKARWGCPPSRDGGTPPHLELTGVTSPTDMDLAGVPPPPGGWTDRHLWKQCLTVVLRTRSVTMDHGYFPCLGPV